MNSNQDKNSEYYNKLYENTDIKGILKILDNPESFLENATKTDTSWVGLYKNNFKDLVVGTKILELGCGDCTNAAILASLGAEVYANDIASKSGDIIQKLNQSFKFKFPIKFIEGDFLISNFHQNNFDFVIGKAFLHHLTHPVEREFFKKITKLLKENGEARFFEPAINSKILDGIRWHIPVSGRPSKFNKVAFKKWKALDPHPERDNSSSHFKKLGNEFFKEVEIIPLGTLERLHRLLPKNFNHRKFRQEAFKIEKLLPRFLNYTFARSQVIIYKKPIL